MAEPITVKINGLNSPIATVKIQNKVAESAVTSVAGKVGDVLLTNADVAGVENVNNTSDLDKPISTATQAAIDSITFTGDYSPTGHQHVLADITNAGTAAAANVGDFATASHQHSLIDITNAGTAAASDTTDFAAASHTHVLADITNLNTGDFASSAQGTLADSALQPGDGVSSLVNDAGYLTGVGDVLTSGSIDTLAKINNIVTTPDLIDTTDSRLADARTPTSHASSHTDGTDDIQDATTGQKGLATIAQIQKLDGIETLADVTDATNVAAAGAQMTSQKGVANGYASLGGDGRVPSSQLPSYVDDVLEYPTSANFPNPGEFGKIYVALDTNYIYRWGGSSYVQVGGGDGVSPPVLSVNTLTGVVVLNPDDLDDSGTTNKFTTQTDIDKLSGIASGAEVNVNADWDATSGDAEILNKPTIGTMAAADTGDYSPTGHQHVLADITDAGTMASADTGSYTLTGHTHPTSDVIGLGTIATYNSGDYALFSHNHNLSNILDAGTSASYDVPAGGDAGLTEVVLGSDTRLTNSRNPLSHASSHVDGFDQIQSATTSQRGLATAAHIQALSGALQSGDNVSLLTNDSLYITSGDIDTLAGINSVIGDATLVTSGYITGNYQPLDPVLTNTTASFQTADETKLDYISVTQPVDLDAIEGASGDMLAATYDPTNVSGDAFSMDNMVEGADTKIFTSGERDKLSGIASGAEVNVNADWTAVGGDAEILNKPAFGDITGSNIADFATSGQGALADTALQSGDNISLLVNDSGYLNEAIQSGDNVSFLTNDALYVASGDNISLLTNDAGYLTSVGTYAYRAETGNYTAVGTDYTINCISGAQTITLPTAAGIEGQVFVVKNSSTGVITITGTASQTIDGYDSIETDFPQSLTLQSTNTNWIII